jgi:hypothetical protein
MSLNQARVVCAGAGLLAVYAVDKLKNRPKRNTEILVTNSSIQRRFQERADFFNLETISNKFSVLADTAFDDDGLVIKFMTLVGY